jgi:hypothetical protein
LVDFEIQFELAIAEMAQSGFPHPQCSLNLASNFQILNTHDIACARTLKQCELLAAQDFARKWLQPRDQLANFR